MLRAFAAGAINPVFACLLVLELFVPALLKFSWKLRARNIIFSVDS